MPLWRRFSRRGALRTEATPLPGRFPKPGRASPWCCSRPTPAGRGHRQHDGGEREIPFAGRAGCAPQLPCGRLSRSRKPVGQEPDGDLSGISGQHGRECRVRRFEKRSRLHARGRRTQTEWQAYRAALEPLAEERNRAFRDYVEAFYNGGDEAKGIELADGSMKRPASSGISRSLMCGSIPLRRSASPSCRNFATASRGWIGRRWSR